MRLFGKKKKRRRGLKVPDHRHEPMCAYIERRSPGKWHGVPLPKKIPPVYMIQDIYGDLEYQVARVHGGGDYVARVFDEQKERDYLGTRWFSVPGEPMVDGERIKPPPPPREKPPEVLECEKRIELAKLLMKNDEIEARLRDLREENRAARERPRAVPPPPRAEPFTVSDAKITIEPPPQPRPAAPKPKKAPSRQADEALARIEKELRQQLRDRVIWEEEDEEPQSGDDTDWTPEEEALRKEYEREVLPLFLESFRADTIRDLLFKQFREFGIPEEADEKEAEDLLSEFEEEGLEERLEDLFWDDFEDHALPELLADARAERG